MAYLEVNKLLGIDLFDENIKKGKSLKKFIDNVFKLTDNHRINEIRRVNYQRFIAGMRTIKSVKGYDEIKKGLLWVNPKNFSKFYSLLLEINVGKNLVEYGHDIEYADSILEGKTPDIILYKNKKNFYYECYSLYDTSAIGDDIIILIEHIIDKIDEKNKKYQAQDGYGITVIDISALFLLKVQLMDNHYDLFFSNINEYVNNHVINTKGVLFQFSAYDDRGYFNCFKKCFKEGFKYKEYMFWNEKTQKFNNKTGLTTLLFN